MKKINIFLAGHNGMVGSAILKKLSKYKKNKLILRNKSELDLRDQTQVKNFFKKEKIDQVYLAAAKVGGINFNSNFQSEFLLDNLMIETNVINSAFNNGVKKLLFLGSSCIYPKLSSQPISEDKLLTGKLEPTNEAYAISKIAGLKLCKYLTDQYGDKKGIDYRSVMPTNIYGDNDTYDLNNSHVIPALLMKFHDAKIKNLSFVEVWGTGKPKREFLHADDLASACYMVMNISKKKYSQITKESNFINIGYGKDISIKDLSFIIKKAVGYQGNIKFNDSKPDGMPRKFLDTKKIRKLGWSPKINFSDGISKTYINFKKSLTINKKDIFLNSTSINNNYLHPLVKSSWNEKEIKTFSEVIESDNFTMGARVKKFEKKFSNFVKSKYTVMVNSGSSANLLMVASLFYIKKNFLKRGDEVIVPAVSWSTTYFPLYQYGLKLVFVDIDLKTLTFDTDQLKKAISKKTKLILAVNLLGNSNNFLEIKKLINKKKIFLLEDNCQAMGTKYYNKFTGTFGISGSYSSFFSHHINTMEGGLIVTNNKEIYQILLSLRAHGWIRELPKKNLVMNKTGNFFKDSFSFALPGYNLRPLEFSAALGIEQLKKLPLILKNRRKNAENIKKILINNKNIILQKEQGKSSWFGFSLIIKPGSKLSRDGLVKKLNRLGFETRPISAGNFARNKVLRLFNYRIVGNLKNADYLDKYGLVIGNTHQDLSKSLKKLSDL